MSTLIFGGSNSQDLAKRIARRTKSRYFPLIATHFPDGELYIKFSTSVAGKKVVIVNSLYPSPDEEMMEVIFAVKTAKELGAKKVTVIAPYLAYMRQDKRFHPGEAKSNTIMSKLLSCADELITIDPHLHRIHSLKEIFKIKTKALTANRVLASYINKNVSNPIVVGPDEESGQWANEIARLAEAEHFVLKKKRYTAEKVRIIVKTNLDLKGRNVVIVDDIISTGHTMIEPIKQLKRMGVKKVYCIGVHGLFVLNALQKLKQLGAKVVSTNTIQSKVSKIDVSELIAEALRV